jgi:FtsZ-interacting cell division protein YlmF
MAGIVDNLKSFLMLDSGDKTPRPAKTPRSSAPAEVRQRPQRFNKGGGVAVIETFGAKSYQDAESVAAILRDNIPVVLDLGDLSGDERKRFLDFLSGLISGLQATARRASADVYVIAPAGIAIESEQAEPQDGDDNRLTIRP